MTFNSRHVTVLTILAASTLCSVTAARAADTPENMSLGQMRSAAVLGHVHHLNQKEIKAAQLALQKSQSTEVKTYAQRMITDHQNADAQVVNLAKAENVTLKDFQPADFEQAQMEQLQSLDGNAFDIAYLDVMRTGHMMALQDLKLVSASTKDPKVKDLLTKIIPTVQQHETMAANYEKSTQNMAGQSAEIKKDQAAHDRDTMNRDMNSNQ
jgi:putative membrane protein